MSTKPFPCDQCNRRFTTADGIAQHKRDSHGVKIKRKRKRKPQPVAPECPYCGSKTACVDSSIIYGRSYGPIWICGNHPDCDAYVGCHPGTKNPLGRLANPELRAAKKAAHAVFDTLWRKLGMRRSEAYGWLAETLGIHVSQCHIGMFDVDLCERTTEAAKDKQRELLIADGLYQEPAAT
jgi:hypothetical protein